MDVDREGQPEDITARCADQSPQERRHALAPGQFIAGRYRIVRLVGEGGMGEVYEAYDQLLHEPVAIKTLRAEMVRDEDVLRRFQREIQLARKVTHPNVCRVFDLGVHEFPKADRAPVHFFTMELLTGITLSARIREGGRLSRAAVFPIALQMAEGLQAAHAVGVVHRDFKSGNVMLTPTPAGERVVITDFGLARLDRQARGQDETETMITGSRLVGTVGYMSPEQMTGGEVTAFSDIYSFGIVLFEMATGHLPFDKRHVIQAAVQRASGKIPDLRAEVPHMDAHWESLIVRCLQLEPAKRFRSAADLADSFRSRPWSLPHARWGRRQWTSITAAAILALALTSGAWYRAHRPYIPKAEAAAWYKRGVTAVQASTYEGGRRALEQAVAIDPQYAPAYAYLAAALEELDYSDRARDAMLHALAAAQDVRLNREDAQRVRAVQLLLARDFDRARPIFLELASNATQRDKPGSLAEMAWLDVKRNDLPDALSELDEALKLDANYAPARLRLARVLAQQRKNDAALRALAEAENLFQASADYEGLIECLLQRAVLLNRSSRAGEAASALDRGMALAATTGDRTHQIRLELARSEASQNLGRVQESQTEAQHAIQVATENKMESYATAGLLDLGSSYLLRGEPAPAETYFKQGLEFARRTKGLFNEARALLSLGSLCVQYDRPSEALTYIQGALPYFRDRGYRREAMQALLLMGGVQQSTADYTSAEATLGEAVQLAAQIHDAEQEGVAHAYLGGLYLDTGAWPNALTELDRALALYKNLRGGLRAAYNATARARLHVREGRYREAAEDLAGARSRIQKLEGPQNTLRAAVALATAESAYSQGQWEEALRQAREAARLQGGFDDSLEAEALSGLAMIRQGSMEEGLALCQRVMEAGRRKSLASVTASTQLLLAEALMDSSRGGQARSLAQEALAFFEPRKLWEEDWRCQRIVGGAAAEQQAIAALKREWPEDIAQSYFNRPDLRKYVQR